MDGRRDRTGITKAEGVMSSPSSMTGKYASDEVFDGVPPTVETAGECDAAKIALERRLKVAYGSGCWETFLGRGTAGGNGASSSRITETDGVETGSSGRDSG